MKNSAKLNLTNLEAKALAAAYCSSDGNGHDFGIVGDVVEALAKDGINAKAAGALMVSLQAKGLFRIHAAVIVNEGTRYADRVVQFVFTPEALATCESLKAEAEAAKWLEAERARTLETVIVRVEGLGTGGDGFLDTTLDYAQRKVARMPVWPRRSDNLERELWQAGIALALAPLHAAALAVDANEHTKGGKVSTALSLRGEAETMANRRALGLANEAEVEAAHIEALLAEVERLEKFAHEQYLAAEDAKRDGHFSDALLLRAGARRTHAKSEALDALARGEEPSTRAEALANIDSAFATAAQALFYASNLLEELDLEAECVAVSKHAAALYQIRKGLQE